MFLIGAKLKSTIIQWLLRPKQGGRWMHNNKMAVVRKKNGAYDAHGKLSILIILILDLMVSNGGSYLSKQVVQCLWYAGQFIIRTSEDRMHKSKLRTGSVCEDCMTLIQFVFVECVRISKQKQISPNLPIFTSHRWWSLQLYMGGIVIQFYRNFSFLVVNDKV